MNYAPIMIRLPLPPSANTRFGVSGGRKILTVEARAWKKAAQWDVFAQVRGIKGLPHKGRCKVTLTIHARAKKDGHASRVMMDRDNASKSPLDALNGLVYLDDSQIAPLIVWANGEPLPGGGITLVVKRY